MKMPAPCPNCQSRNLFKSLNPIRAGGGYSPDFLQGLGKWYRGARFDVIVCRDCGLTRFFAEVEALEQIESSKQWVRIESRAARD